MKRITIYILIIFVHAYYFSAGTGEDKTYDASGNLIVNEDIDYLGVAALMVRDGRYDRAEQALKKVNLLSAGLDKIRYYTIYGLVNLRQHKYREAIDSFNTAVGCGQKDSSIYAYLAQAYFANKEFKETIISIEKMKEVNRFPELLAIKAQSYWELGDISSAYKLISRASVLFPSKDQFKLQKIVFLLELELNQEASHQSEEYLRIFGDKSAAYLTIGEALRRGGELDEALKTLEKAKLKYPDDSRVILSLAQTYFQKNKNLTAAKLVEKMAVFEPEYYYEAAELYRKAKNYGKALYLNSILIDPFKKARQRFSLLLDLYKYEEALALEQRLTSMQALEDDSMCYAMAYVHFQTQQYDKAVDYLKRIKDLAVFREATQLRKAIELIKKGELNLF